MTGVTAETEKRHVQFSSKLKSHKSEHIRTACTKLTEPGSRVTEAVNPAALDPLPEVYTYSTETFNPQTQ